MWTGSKALLFLGQCLVMFIEKIEPQWITSVNKQ